MGCTTSKQARRDRRRPPSPLARTHSLPHDLKSSISGNDHDVALTSSTLVSVKLDKDSGDGAGEEAKKSVGDDDGDLSSKLSKAKFWSETMKKRIPTTPTETPPNEPEVIDALELMAGLEETATPPRFSTAAIVDRHSFSFYPIHESNKVLEPVQSTIWSNTLAPLPSPVWKPAKIDEHSIIGEFDPEVLSAFRKAMEELSPKHPCLLRSPESRTPSTLDFQGRFDSKKAGAKARKDSGLEIWPPGGKGKVVLYFTSLRGVRKTYEDCFLVRMILKGYGIRVDERDVSMDRGFWNELDEMLGADHRRAVLLPSVFANGRYVGGVEEVRRMHEDAELTAAFKDCGVAAGGPCEDCGDVRFVICGKCSGSCKVYIEEEEEEEGEEEEEEEEEEWEDVGGGFQRCRECNENGIVRCSACCC